VAAEKSNKRWAWEFLRRDAGYREIYGAWRAAADRGIRVPKGKRAKMERLLTPLGSREQRYRDWIEAAFQSGLPFIIDSNPLVTPDPHRYLLRRWVDPNLEPHEVEGLEHLFSADSLVEPAQIWRGTAEHRILEELGILDRRVKGGNWDLRPAEKAGEIQIGDGEKQLVEFEVLLRFDLQHPLGEQLKLAEAYLRERATATLPVVLNALSLLQAPEKTRTDGLDDALDMFDAYTLFGSVIEAARALSGDRTLNVKDPDFKTYERSLARARRLVGGAWRSYAIE
jgi:hypothetical protein